MLSMPGAVLGAALEATKLVITNSKLKAIKEKKKAEPLL